MPGVASADSAGPAGSAGSVGSACSDRSDRATAAVVGGGVAGMVAAWELARAGAQVTLFERETSLGGRIASTMLAGHRVDLGAEAFATRNGGVQALLVDLGIADEIVSPAALGSWVFADGQALPLPAGGAVGIPARPLSRASRSVLGWGGALRASAGQVWPIRARVTRDTSLAELVRTRLGQRVLERLVRPVCLGVYSREPELMSVGAIPGLYDAYVRTGGLVRAARELRASALSAGGAVAALPGGMFRLIDVLEHELERLGVQIRTGVTIVAIGGADRDRIILRNETGACVAEADGLVVATQQSAASALFGWGEGSLPATELSDVVEVVALALTDARLDAAPRGTGMLVAPAGEQTVRAKALTHVTAKWPDRAAQRGPSEHVLRLSYGRAGTVPETVGLSDAVVRALALQDASELLGVELADASIQACVRQQWHAGGQRCEVVATPSRIAVAGDWVHGTGLASVIPGARTAARDLISNLRQASTESVTS
ncbi:protoporphyrinogen oxidase [Leucobacter sp. cx-328]|uniref:protoporphyrinogen oxidase n=1 Tax=unclassified Leucobacter TaxID=2621730 RepID=UPI00165E46C5|nr:MULTISPECIES: protoporphyrinogen oxidase [unclassified Leucobacter]MBC9944601.1 protoporphyrinogen oxidase [Leucobacter sp. cx-328]